MQDAGVSEATQPPTPRRRLSPGPGLDADQVAAHQLARIHEATIAIVAEQGYQALRVRDIVRRAEVSTRAFYEHYASKEDCFRQAHQLIARRANRRIIAAQAGEPDWRERPRLILQEFVQALESDPARARVALIEAYAASEELREQAKGVERVFGEMVAESLARPPKGMAVPPLVVEGMVSGIVIVSKKRLAAGKVRDLSKSSEKLVDWILSYPDPSAAKLAELDRQSVWRDTTLQSASLVGGEPFSSSGDRALILAAVAKLAAAKGYDGLTAARIRSTATVSRRKFEAHFEGAEDCYLAALEQRAGVAMAQAARAQTAASSPAGGVYRAIAALCDHIAADPFLTRVCLKDDFPPGANGARTRQRLMDALEELLVDVPSRSDRLITEASIGAAWSLFYDHVVRGRSLRRPISATLAYLALAPAISPQETICALEREQSP